MQLRLVAWCLVRLIPRILHQEPSVEIFVSRLAATLFTDQTPSIPPTKKLNCGSVRKKRRNSSTGLPGQRNGSTNSVINQLFTQMNYFHVWSMPDCFTYAFLCKSFDYLKYCPFVYYYSVFMKVNCFVKQSMNFVFSNKYRIPANFTSANFFCNKKFRTISKK